MEKTKRLNDMLIYLNDKKSFQLKDIMKRYSISKSTAIRDIQALDEIGMPIYSHSGRNGHYEILANRLLSPIVFTMDEVKALYFSMQTLNDYQSTPFHLSVGELKRKFESCISKERIQRLRKMELIFSLRKYQNKSDCRLLGEILQMASDESVCEICYRKQEVLQRYYVQFFKITSAYGQWYATAYNFETGKPQVFRCDKVHSVELSNKYKAKALAEFLLPSAELFRDETAVDFVVAVSEQGVDKFQKENYPSMELLQENGVWYIKGFYNKGEETFIANYFIAYGETIRSIQPEGLKELIIGRLDEMKNHLINSRGERNK
ncbi:YafY family protein [Azotosporobacter soli]|uniref:helix-turn-helix transcriptional regulator n=1 Tax=Azotosporobacter soli TaxID=3055040 RepID=UPI0031FF1320